MVSVDTWMPRIPPTTALSHTLSWASDYPPNRALLPKVPRRHQTQHERDNSPVLYRLVLKACLFFLCVMPLPTAWSLTQARNLNEYVTNPCSPLLSHYHDFSSDSLHFSPGWLSEIPISVLISFQLVLHSVTMVLLIQDATYCVIGVLFLSWELCLEPHYWERYITLKSHRKP